MKPQFRRLMTHRVRIVKLDRNYAGQLLPIAEHLNIPAYVQYGKSIAVDRQGEEVTAAAIVFLQPDAPVDPEHEHWAITQTHPYSRGKMQIITINPIDDPRTSKTHHYEVLAR